MAKLTWMPSALIDIDNIATYISQDSPQGAQTQVAAFFDRATILEKYPTFGRPVPELKDSRYRQILEGHYRIIYQVTEDEVFILSVHHQAMLLSNNPVFKRKMRRSKK